MIIEKDETELVNSLHKLADWVEKDNHVQCHSVPRKAAYTIVALTEENTKLKDMLAIKTRPVSEKARAEVQETIESLRAEVKDLEFKLRTMTQSRNEFQSKNAEMIKQLNYWKKRVERAEKALESK
jgi:septal ring factor EnvC (AmiA/AmiB activator)